MSKFVKFLMSISKWQVNFFSIFVSFFIVMRHDCYVDFKIILLILWIKGSHQSTYFETFKCSDENLPYSSCHFSDHKSGFLQILHHSSVLGQTLNTLHNRNQRKCKFMILSSGGVKFYQSLVIAETTDQFFYQILHQSSWSWDITPLYFFTEKFIYFQQKEPVKVQIWWNYTLAVQGLKLCTLMESFCPNQVHFQLKRHKELSLMKLKRDTNFKEKLLAVSNMA